MIVRVHVTQRAVRRYHVARQRGTLAETSREKAILDITDVARQRRMLVNLTIARRCQAAWRRLPTSVRCLVMAMALRWQAA
jgi:hypothetical protein